MLTTRESVKKMYMLLLSVICFNFATQTNAECSNAEYGRFCTLQAADSPESSPVTVEIIDDQLFVGTTNYLQIFNLPELQHAESVELSSDSHTVEQCSGFGPGQLGENREDCKNFIRTIQRFPGENQQQVMVCGTNAHFPECNVHQVENASNYRKLSAPGQTDAGYSSNSNTHPIEALWASNGNFFTATRFDNSLIAIRMSPGALQNDTTFTVGTPQDDRWLNTPSFVSVHEFGDHVFFFMSEPALELDGVQEVRYSRVIRICKTDAGNSDTTDPRSNVFLTFQKARIVCSVDKGGGSIPFFYNDLISTFLGETASGIPVLYGAFNSPINGPAGGAICKFSFDMAINRVFDDRDYLVRMEDSNGVVWVKDVAPIFTCPGSQSGDQRSTSDVQTYQLKFDSITPTQNLPLFVSDAEFLDKIVAETVEYMGDVQEILYYTNQQGDIMQVVLSSANTGKQYQHMIYDSDSPNPVEDLILHHINNERSLIASSSGQIIQIPRGKCSDYTDCFSCFDSKDAYCGWDSQKCLNKFERNKFESNNTTLIQTFSASEASIITECGNRPTPTVAPTEEPVLPCSQNPSTTDDPSSVEITSNTEEQEKEDCTTRTTAGGTSLPGGLSGGNTSGYIGIPVVVGASFGAFLFGLSIGSVICIVFCKYSKSNKKGFSPEVPKENSDPLAPTRNETIVVMQVNNNNVTEKEKLEKSEKIEVVSETKLKPAPPPRYIQHNPSSVLKPAPAPPTVAKPTLPIDPLGSTTSLPPLHKHSNGTINRHQFPDFLVEEASDSAFADKDTVPPLKTFHSTGSLGRNKAVTTRKQRLRTDSTTRLITRQRSESLSSDISSNSSPLQSPISDV